MSLVSLVLYFTCMKKSTTSSILVRGDGQGDHRIPEEGEARCDMPLAEVDVRRRHRSRRPHQQGKKDDRVRHRADDLVFLLVFLVRFAHRCLPRMPADQIQQGEEIDPDNVDKVPVKPEVFDKRDMSRGIRSGLRSEDHEDQDRDTASKYFQSSSDCFKEAEERTVEATWRRNRLAP